MKVGRQFGSTMISARSATASTTACSAAAIGSIVEPQGADVQELHLGGERREGLLGRQRGRAGPLGVEAIGRRAVGVELGQGERRRSRRVDRGVEPDAILDELGPQPRAEPVVGQAPQVVHVLLEPAQCARGVVRPAPGMRAQFTRLLRHQIDERFSSDDDRHAP